MRGEAAEEEAEAGIVVVAGEACPGPPAAVTGPRAVLTNLPAPRDHRADLTRLLAARDHREEEAFPGLRAARARAPL